VEQHEKQAEEGGHHSVPVLRQEIMKLWVLETTQEYLKKLSDSMPKRLQQSPAVMDHFYISPPLF
jgi:hypothetical protein